MKIEKQTLSGLIGPVVAVSNPDGTYLRSRPSYLNDPKTSAQLQQRSKMQQVQDFIKPILPFAKAFYLESDARHNYYNALVSWLLYGAFDAENTLQAAKARIMHGSLTRQKGTLHYSKVGKRIFYPITDIERLMNGTLEG